MHIVEISVVNTKLLVFALDPMRPLNILTNRYRYTGLRSRTAMSRIIVVEPELSRKAAPLKT
jgi:hypothetical protein